MKRMYLAVPFLSAVLGGALGGIGVQWLLANPSAVAEPVPQTAAIVTAQEFKLVGATGRHARSWFSGTADVPCCCLVMRTATRASC